MADSSRWNLAMVASSRFFFQLKEGEQLYDSIGPGIPFDRFGEATGFFQVRLGGFAPDQVGVRRVGQAAGDGLVETGATL
jgi:hypothetical protein